MTFRALKIIISAILIAFAIKLLDWTTIVKTIRDGSPAALFFAVSINILTFTVLGFRWFCMIGSSSKMSFLSHLAIYFRATFLNTFTPANLGGDMYRALTLKSSVLPVGKIIKILIRERFIGLYGYLIVFFSAWLFIYISGQPHLAAPYMWGAALVICAFVAPIGIRILSPVVRKTILHMPFSEESKARLNSWVDILANIFFAKDTPKLLLMSVAGTLLWVTAIKAVALGFGLPTPFVELAAVATLVEVIRIIPMTIQGIGIREGVFAYLFGALGHNSNQGYAIGIMIYLALSVAIVLTGPIGTLLGYFSKPRKAA